MKYTAEQRAIAADNGLCMPTVYYRVNKLGWDVERAIKIPPHKGIFTEEQREQAMKNGISYNALYTRLSQGWSMKEAINIPLNAHRVLTDEEYEIAESNGISRSTAYDRVSNYLWEVEDAITMPLDKAKSYNSRKGRHWSKIPKELKEQAAANGISLSTLHKRLFDYHWSEKKAVSTPVRQKIVSLSKEEIQTVIKNGLNTSTVYSRLRAGWDKQKAISTPPKTKGNRKNA